MDLKDRAAIVTGASRGLGRSMALALAEEGCNVLCVARDERLLAQVAEQADALPGKVATLKCDLADVRCAPNIVDRAVELYGGLDVLVNNAGILIKRPFLEVTEKEYDLTMDVNLKSMFFLCQRALNVMKERRAGYIINVSSTVALGVPAAASTYGISKCGVAGLSQALYETAKEFGVKVTVVYPGITDTEMVREARRGDASTNPDQWMKPEDIAGCVLFLLKQSPRIVMKELVPWAVGFDRI